MIYGKITRDMFIGEFDCNVIFARFGWQVFNTTTTIFVVNNRGFSLAWSCIVSRRRFCLLL